MSVRPAVTRTSWPPPRAVARVGGRRSIGGLRAVLKHPLLTTYHRLMAAVVLVNLGVLLRHLGDWQIADGTALSALSTLALINVTGAVLIRQAPLLNLLYGLAGRGSRTWPRWIRWSVSKVHHVGGLHAGFALAATAWLGAFCAVTFVAAGPESGDGHHDDAGAVPLSRRPRRGDHGVCRTADPHARS